jgi:2',3'-cyclic-nucleotide 2'-phosphodiesterase (5'-nucleotidase family)
MPAAFSKGVRFTIGNEELPGWIAQVRDEERAEVVVVLSHLGFPQDVKLAGEVAGIDILVSGHTHNRMAEAIVVNGAIVFQSGCHGSFVGRLDVDVDNGSITEFRHQLVPVDTKLTENADVAAMVEAAQKAEPEELGHVVGTVEVPLHRYAMLNSSMDDVLLEAIANAAGTSIAFSNGWRYGAPIAPGPVTVNDLWNIIPTNPPVSVVDLTGREILEMLETNLERTFAADPYEQMGGFVKRMRGIVMYFKAENPCGHRIDRLFADGRPVEPERSYSVAFVTAQGVPAKFGSNRRQLDIDAIAALRRLFERSGTVAPSRKECVHEI